MSDPAASARAREIAGGALAQKMGIEITEASANRVVAASPP
jgi:hypothetical protein